MRQVPSQHLFPARSFFVVSTSAHSLTRHVTAAILVVALFLLSSGSLWAQGVTSGGIDGVVTDAAGQPLAGASVTAVHVPSGTTYQTVVRTGGVFVIGGMRVGGPYAVTAGILGHQQETREEVYVVLGQNARLSFALTETAIELEALTVTADQDPLLNSDRTGAATTIPNAEVRALPSVRRSTRDLTRLDPRNDGNFSFGGRNWLYNNITLDGSYFNNSFGLDDPAPGGQTATEPVPYDAVEQVTVQVAPFDVRQSGFTGASINTVTKSGTNDWKVSGFAFYRNQDLQGNKVSGEDVIANPDLSVGQYGFSVGGPLIKDRLFFFLSGELTQREDPGTNFVARTGAGPAGPGESRVSADSLELIKDRMATVYDYDTGPFEGFVHETNSNKVLLKVDWNLGSNHNLMFRYNRLDAERDLPPHPFAISYNNTGRGPNDQSLPFQNSGYQINNELNSYAFEWNARSGTGKWANRLFASYNRFRDFRNARSVPFPTLEIGEGGITYTTVGHEPFSIENNLDTDVWQFTNDFTYFAGRHSLTVGANFERFGFFNSFNLFRYGAFGFSDPGFTFDGFDSLDEFFDRTDPDSPSYIELRDFVVTGDYKGENIDLGQLGVYLQDQWAVTPRFSLSAGLRVDFPMYFTDPVDNPYSRGLTAINGDGESVVVDQSQLAGTQALWSPRVGFNWDVTGDRSTQLRGGTGIFTGRLPFVWVGNVISNPSANPNIWPAPGAPKVVTSGPRPGSGEDSFILQQSSNGVNAMDPDFKWPQMWTTNIAIDQRLPWDVIGTLEFIYGKDINNIYMQNMDLAADSTTLADGRPLYPANQSLNGDAIYVLSNTDEGRNYNITLQLRKQWESGLGLGISYAYLDATNTLKSTEIASAVWTDQPTPGSPNLPIAAPSEFGQRHRIVATGTYAKRWSDLLRTSFGLFWEVAEGNTFRNGGNRYSFIYSGDVNGDGASGNDLMYIPEGPGDINLVDPSQWNALNAFIEQDSYLSNHRGEIAERFGLLNPWYTDLSVRILQDFIFGSGEMDNVLQVSVDFENLLNLFNSSWGVRQVASSAALSPLTFTGNYDAQDRPEVVFNGVQETFVDDLSEYSRWRIQLGIRYFMD